MQSGLNILSAKGPTSAHMPSTNETLSLGDLKGWPESGVNLAVIGHPIKHSLSPLMHNAALGTMSRSHPELQTWKYWKFDVPPEELPIALKEMQNRRFLGVNLTVPHKVLAMRLLTHIDPAAEAIGAVNTLRLGKDGYEGFNTDGYGLVSGLHEDLGLSCHGADVVLLGAGGAARGAAIELVRQGCKKLWIGNRSPRNLDEMILAVERVAGSIPVQRFLFSELPSDLPSNAIVINSTAAGLDQESPAPIQLRSFPRPLGVYDMIYKPSRTKLLLDAEALGIPSANGLSMLVHQGARALGIWTGTQVPVVVMRDAARAGLRTSPA